jgi:hypothetical protein
MALLAPPPPPLVTFADHNGRERLRFRLWQIGWTMATLIATAWCMTLGWIPAIVALMIAKHILVAILVIGIDRERAQVRK